MWKRFCGISVFCLGLGLSAQGQGALPLETFLSPDGAFQFIYPQNYQLLVGDGMLKGTQGRHSGVSVCDFSTALACVIYPIDAEQNTRFEAAAFSVDRVPGVSVESECLAYSDRRAEGREEMPPAVSTSINGVDFWYVSSRKKAAGRVQASESYRIYREQKCYELRIDVSISEDGTMQRASEISPRHAVEKKSGSSLGEPAADSARDSLRLILWSFTFK